ncbi:MAG TPA: glycosyltransferase [Solirubrobacteraceae bacterium]
MSICIPAYARPEYLRAAIESVLTQTFSDLEVIVSDDSGDGEEVARSFGDARVRYHANPHRLGMVGNWEAALGLARGRYVSLLMDDDRLLPDYVATLRGVLDSRPAVGIAFANHLFDDDGAITARAELIPPGLHRSMLELLVRFNPVPICSTMMRREVLASVLPLPENHAADFVMMMRAALAGVMFYYVSEPLMVYRVHSEQLSGQEEFREHVRRLWDEFDFPEGSEIDVLRRQQPMWQ